MTSVRCCGSLVHLLFSERSNRLGGDTCRRWVYPKSSAIFNSRSSGLLRSPFSILDIWAFPVPHHSPNSDWVQPRASLIALICLPSLVLVSLSNCPLRAILFCPEKFVSRNLFPIRKQNFLTFYLFLISKPFYKI